MFKNMNLLKTEDIYKLEMAKFMHKLNNNQLPIAFSSHFTRIDSMHSYNLRSTKTKVFYTKKTNTKQYKSWITQSGVELWSAIDPSVKELSLKTFSFQFRKNLIQTY